MDSIKTRKQILEEYGIQLLTGERCSFGMRLLCDVNEKGKNLIERFFSVDDIKLDSPWNLERNDKNGSIMLSQKTLSELALFAVLTTNSIKNVMLCTDGRMILDVEEENIEEYKRLYCYERFFVLEEKDTTNKLTGNNQHQMSGRF